MRHGATVRSIAVALVLVAGSSRVDAAAEIYWYKDLKQASAAAQKAGLPMFIDFWADWCAACKIMDAEVYTDSQVITAFQEHIIGVRLHFDLQTDVARRYNVPALPYLLFTTSYGTPLVYHRGILEADDLAKVVKALPPLAEINRLDRSLEQDRNNLVSLVAMARALRTAAFFESSNTYYDRASRHPAAKADPAQYEAILFETGLNSLELKDGRKAAASLEKCLAAFPKSARRPEILLALGRAYALDERHDKARASLNSVITEYQGTPAAAQARALLDPAAGADVTQLHTEYLDLVTYLTESAVTPGTVFSIVAEISPHAGMHLYAPGDHAYKVIAIKVDPQPFLIPRDVRYPPSEPYLFKPLKERVPVFQKPFRLTQDLTLDGSPAARKALASKKTVTITGMLDFQACDDKICFLPQSVPLSYTVVLRARD
jgi:thioredoxin-like negative regulator of GroEL